MKNHEKFDVIFNHNIHRQLRRVIIDILKIKQAHHLGSSTLKIDLDLESKGEKEHFFLMRAKKPLLNLWWLSFLLMPCHVFLSQKPFLIPLKLANINFGGVTTRMTKKINWITWDKLQKNKRDGGFGLGGFGLWDLHNFNLALLVKQAWKILHNLNGQWVKLFKSLYFTKDLFLIAKYRNNSYWAWKSILKGTNLLLKGLCWKVGNGNNIDIWKDPWIPNIINFRLNMVSQEPPQLHKVYQLINSITRVWNLNGIHSVIFSKDINILQIPLSLLSLNDKLIWSPNKKGIFSVESAYFLSTSLDHHIRPCPPIIPANSPYLFTSKII